MNASSLKSICNQNVVELIFTKRSNSTQRRMLATLDFNLLNSDLGKQIFKFQPPRYSPPFNAETKGLVTVFDIIMLNWRNVPAAAANIITAIATNPQEEFWKYFDQRISKMSSTQKAAFMRT